MDLVPLSELILGRYLPQNEGLRARARRNGCGLGMQGVVKKLWRCPPWRVRPGRRAVGRNSRPPQVGPGTPC